MKKLPVVKIYLDKLKPSYGPEFTGALEIFIANSNLDEGKKELFLTLIEQAYEMGMFSANGKYQKA